jgi:hypothetical protein
MPVNPSYPGGRNQENHGPGQTVGETLSPKYPTQKRAGGVAQVVECLHSKHEALVPKKKNKK